MPYDLVANVRSYGIETLTADSVEGFLLDRGFQVFLTAYPEPRAVLDYGALDFQRFVPGAKVWRGGRLHTLADRLEGTYGAPVCAALVREAAEVYARRDLLARPTADDE